ncbi:MAG: sigma-70 family RNA polymerase sigma factor [Planctomycetota bacterium]
MKKLAQAFARFVQPHWQRLHFVARRYVAREHDAQDLVQETLLRAWRNFAPTHERSYGRAWLFVIMRNVVNEWQRTGRRRIRLVPDTGADLTEVVADDASALLSPLPTVGEQEFREFLDDCVAAALDELDPAFREVILLSVAGGLSYREIAEALDRPLGTVMSRMGRARRALRDRLAGYARAQGFAAERKP